MATLSKGTTQVLCNTFTFMVCGGRASYITQGEVKHPLRFKVSLFTEACNAEYKTALSCLGRSLYLCSNYAGLHLWSQS